MASYYLLGNFNFFLTSSVV